MNFFISCCFYGLVFFGFSGCSCSSQKDGLLANNGAITAAESIPTSENQGKEALQALASSLNFMNWVAPAANGTDVSSLSLEDFSKNTSKLENIIDSPYFWISLWNGYEQHKNATTNLLDEAAIKKIFQTSLEIKDTETNIAKKGLQTFIESILAFVDGAASSVSLSTTQKKELALAITEFSNPNGATSAVHHFENLLLHTLWYSINKKLESSHVFAHPASGEFYFKKDFKGSNQLSADAMQSIQGLTLLKEFINKRMIPPLAAGQSYVAKATSDKTKHINRLDKFIQTIETTFNVSNPFVHNNQLSEGGSNSFLTNITNTTDTNNLIPLLISTSSLN